MTQSNHPEGEREPFDAEQFARDTNYSIDFTDWAVDAAEDRITRLEEIIAARWPRSMLLRRRLARELRASVAGLDEAAAGLPRGFRKRRAEAIGHDIVWAAAEHRQRRRGAR